MRGRSVSVEMRASMGIGLGIALGHAVGVSGRGCPDGGDVVGAETRIAVGHKQRQPSTSFLTNYHSQKKCIVRRIMKNIFRV